MATQRRQTAHESAEDLWKRLRDTGENGLPRTEAMGRNTPAQFEHTTTWIRNRLREQEGVSPLRRPKRDDERGDEGR
jgi:hypothetical protein